jgi:YggT family protein
VSYVYEGAGLAIFAYLVLLTGRVVISWVLALSPHWRPHGIVLIATEICFAATDRPVRFLRSLLPSINVGSFRIDLAVPVLYLACYIALNLLLVARNG